MSPEEWAAQWLDDEETSRTGASPRLIRYESQLLDGVPLDGEDRRLLTEVGLPDSAAPFLEFSSGLGLLGHLRKADAAPTGTSQYVEIGTNGSGDPICLAGDTGSVAYLNHDQGYEAVLVNSSVGRLAECLLAFRALVRASLRENGREAYLDGDFSIAALDLARSVVGSVDPVCLRPGSMWHSELGL